MCVFFGSFTQLSPFWQSTHICFFCELSAGKKFSFKIISCLCCHALPRIWSLERTFCVISKVYWTLFDTWAFCFAGRWLN